jgi:hypothetical protein
MRIIQPVNHKGDDLSGEEKLIRMHIGWEVNKNIRATQTVPNKALYTLITPARALGGDASQGASASRDLRHATLRGVPGDHRDNTPRTFGQRTAAGAGRWSAYFLAVGDAAQAQIKRIQKAKDAKQTIREGAINGNR